MFSFKHLLISPVHFQARVARIGRPLGGDEGVLHGITVKPHCMLRMAVFNGTIYFMSSLLSLHPGPQWAAAQQRWRSIGRMWRQRRRGEHWSGWHLALDSSLGSSLKLIPSCSSAQRWFRQIRPVGRRRRTAAGHRNATLPSRQDQDQQWAYHRLDRVLVRWPWQPVPHRRPLGWSWRRQQLCECDEHLKKQTIHRERGIHNCPEGQWSITSLWFPYSFS